MGFGQLWWPLWWMKAEWLEHVQITWWVPRFSLRSRNKIAVASAGENALSGFWTLSLYLYILGFSRYDLSRYHCLRLDNFLDQSLSTAMPTTSHNNHRRCYHCQVVVETRCCNAAQSWSPMVSGPPSNPASLGSLRAVATWWPMVSFNLLGSNQNQTSIVEEIANWNIRLFCLEFFPTNVF